jgi:hypothetical protein
MSNSQFCKPLYVLGRVLRNPEDDNEFLDIHGIFRDRQDAVNRVKEYYNDFDEDEKSLFRYTQKDFGEKTDFEEEILDDGEWKKSTDNYFVIRPYFLE